jgi:hypothetical protein
MAMKPPMKAAAKPSPATKKAPAGKITLQQALAMYDDSPADKAADLAAAKKLMAAHNAKVK